MEGYTNNVIIQLGWKAHKSRNTRTDTQETRKRYTYGREDEQGIKRT